MMTLQTPLSHMSSQAMSLGCIRLHLYHRKYLGCVVEIMITCLPPWPLVWLLHPEFLQTVYHQALLTAGPGVSIFIPAWVTARFRHSPWRKWEVLGLDCFLNKQKLNLCPVRKVIFLCAFLGTSSAVVLTTPGKLGLFQPFFQDMLRKSAREFLSILGHIASIILIVLAEFQIKRSGT